ncbi:hypothetical protein BKA60DRAFT_623750 [Fusarium oxysporum]|nr:hypothetical protein BKA60DRAFT_623750 [Fusarium oxysporum]
MFMIMKFTIFFLMLFPTASLSLPKRNSKTFKLESLNESKGYFDMGGAAQLSELVNCTAERAKENGDDRGNCKIQSSKIGIILNSTITDTYNMLLDTSLENKKSILEAVRDVASPKTMEYVNLEGLVVIPCTNSSLVIPKGKRGYWMFAAHMNCWPGTLDDCDNDDNLDDTDVVVCGSELIGKGAARVIQSIVAGLSLWRIVTPTLGSNLVLGHGQTMTGLLRWPRSGGRMMCMWRSHWPRGFTICSRL